MTPTPVQLSENTPVTQPKSARFGREIVWVGLLIASIVFVSSTRVTTYLGARGRGRASIWSIWRDLTTDLPGGDSSLVTVGYVLVIVVFVVASFGCLWLALTAGPAVDAADIVETRQSPVTTLPEAS